LKWTLILYHELTDRHEGNSQFSDKILGQFGHNILMRILQRIRMMIEKSRGSKAG